jgi:HAD superfamily hydrolase (TIGR01490 family)
MKTKLAVFDIDGTIFRWTFIAELMQALTKKGIISKDVIKKTEKVYFDWKDRKGLWDDYIRRVVKVTNNALKGLSEEIVDEVIQEIVLYKKDNLYVFTRDLIKKLKIENYFLLAISASPEKIVSEFTKALDFDEYYGTSYEIINGKYTGKELNEIYSVKHEILNKFLKDNPQITLKDSIGVGDSDSDIPFLEMVNNPIAFNPNLKLAQFAKSKKWRIVVERKNVVYDLKDFDLITN